MTHRRHMEEAVALADVLHPHPNPRVGAVVLDTDGAVVGRGAHAGPGTPHAEVLALDEAGSRARGGTVVVTLEPCDHDGRTPPCTSALLDAKVGRVVVGVVDPDERVSGRGIARLRDAGVEIEVGIASEIVEELDPGYLHHRRTGRPLVTVKVASTLDGQVAAADGSSQWITSVAAREDGHRLRARSDAVMVGAGTALADDPRLTVRLPGHEGPQPRPVLVAGRRPIPPSLTLFGRDPLVYAAEPVDLPGEVVVVPGPDGVDLPSVIDDLGKRGIVDVLVEGGPTLVGSLFRSGSVDRIVVYLAASVAGGVGRPAVDGVFETIGAEVPVEIRGVELVGGDVRVDAVVGTR